MAKTPKSPAVLVKPVHACPTCKGELRLIDKAPFAVDGKTMKIVRTFRCAGCARLNSKTTYEKA